jgi:hypothetical protein
MTDLLQTQRNLAYGLQIRIAGLIRRGEDQAKIDKAKALYAAVMKDLAEKESAQ